MDTVAFLIDFILNIDRYLEAFVQAYGVWIYVLLFLIVFVETGVVFMPFLPGDSLLFVVGAMAGAGFLNLPLVLTLLLIAAILGDQCNYLIGRHFGTRLLESHSRWFNRDAYDRSHAFYERYGGITIIIARFMPFVRTFAPFVAGVSHMDRRRFSAYNVVGAVLWVVGIGMAGYWFGNNEWVQANFEKVIWALILVPGLIALLGIWRAKTSG
jgi:membrane-associated protein